LLCEQNEETSSQLLQIEKPVDTLAEIQLSKTTENASEEGVLIHFFGTNLYSRIALSDLISFEAIPILGELSKGQEGEPCHEIHPNELLLLPPFE
jgi:hypothetical protein